MRPLRVLAFIIALVLAVSVLPGCSGLRSEPVGRKLVSEQLIARVESSSLVSSVQTSPDAKHVAYATKDDDGYSLAVDGIEVEQYDLGVVFVFSPDSTHMVSYTKEDKKSFTVTGGIEDEQYEPEWPGYNGISPDGKRRANKTHINNKRSVVVDGVENKQYDEIGTFVFSPDSQHFAYVVVEGNSWFVVVDGTEGKQYENARANLDRPLLFSPDSNRLAYVAEEGLFSSAYRAFIVLNGVEGKRYTSLDRDSLVFSPDSSHLAYQAVDDKEGSIIVVDGEEKEKARSYGSSLTFSPDGTRLAYIGRDFTWFGRLFPLYGSLSQSYERFVIIDGKEGKRYRTVSDLTFSPDSKHVVYLASLGAKEFVVVNRVAGGKYDSFYHGSVVTALPTPVSERIPSVSGRRIAFDSPESFHYLMRRGDGIYLVEETLERE